MHTGGSSVVYGAACKHLKEESKNEFDNEILAFRILQQKGWHDNIVRCLGFLILMIQCAYF